MLRQRNNGIFDGFGMPLLRSRRFATVAALVALMLAGVACGSNDAAESDSQDILATGKTAFESRCSGCHGIYADGTTAGPPLVHKIYEVGHHPDWSFRNAVANGVRSHHWNFGDMAPIEGVPEDEVTAIICYVRDLQRQAGIEAGEAC